MNIDGATRLHIIVGDPIAQVKSPAGLTRALQQAGHNAVIVPVHVTPADLSALLGGIGLARNMDGIIVTIPHKFACYRHCATATARAHALEAVNVMRRNQDGTWHGEMLDGLGFVGGVRRQGGEPAGKRTLLVGAGGAGSAIGLALLDAGASHLDIHDADAARRDALIARLDAQFPGKVGAGSADPRGYQLIANATPAGMRPEDPSPVDLAGLDPAMFVGCVITAPAVAPWVAAARAKGCRGSVGIDMFEAEQQLMVDFLLAAER
ncbi:MAG: shikimate dehydrogenase [Rhodospirillales bacterium]|nr:shikimate dehydrogenase [Rhodospirillales bacterium]MDE2200585.1 shikimate dehydrogenase [Rhodospirillales bacterium]MDE2575760.1 shikimate dehydrogenase [Rhodospirillales bacterium]